MARTRICDECWEILQDVLARRSPAPSRPSIPVLRDLETHLALLIRRDLNLQSPGVARILLDLLKAPGKASRASVDRFERASEKVLVSRLRKDLARFGCDDAVVTVRRNVRDGEQGGYMFMAERVADLKPFLSFDLGLLDAEPPESPEPSEDA